MTRSLLAVLLLSTLFSGAQQDEPRQPTGFVDISAGREHTCASTAGGTVWCWGRNDHGQLGDGSTRNSPNPVAVPGLSGVTALAIGEVHSCALTGDGRVWCWGRNHLGQLGNGATKDSRSPEPVAGIAGAVSVTSGQAHSCAVLSDGTARCWGGDYRGQLGDGAPSTSPSEPTPVPVAVKGLAQAKQIVGADAYHTCALVADGRVYCWGWNDDGQVGNGTDGAAPVSTPALVAGLPAAVDLATGATQSCALVADGRVWCWGKNNFGQLGDGSDPPGLVVDPTDAHSDTPRPVRALSGVSALSNENGGGHFCALARERVWCWGHNGFGQLGDGTLTHQSTPVVVPGLGQVVAVTGGGDHACAVVRGGEARCWGWNSHGQLGDGTTTNRAGPVPVGTHAPSRPSAVPGLSGVRAISAGANHTCALGGNRTVFCWGDDTHGQLGDGTTVSADLPRPVAGLNDVAAIDAGADHTCAVTTGKELYCWGNNDFGQLGDGTKTNRSTPVRIDLPGGVTTVAAGRHNTCAIVGGRVYCWGWSFINQLGDVPENPTHRTVPVPVAGAPEGATAVTAGGDHVCAVVAGGKVYCWGLTLYGQAGNPAQVRSKPTEVSGLPGRAKTVEAGRNHTCAIANTVQFCWGDNTFGQLGHHTGGWLPAPATESADTTAIATGADHTCVVLADGSVTCRGRNDHGQLGDGTTADSPTPVTVPGLPPVRAVTAGAAHTCALLTTETVTCWGADLPPSIMGGFATHA